jgi:hypothetical protein
MLKSKLTPEDLPIFFDVNFDSGKLFWKERDKSYFSSTRFHAIWNKRFAGKQAFSADHKDGYKHGILMSKAYLAHRVIYAMKHGVWPNYIDHINGDKSDNRISNLRSVTKSENGCNSKKPYTNKSGYIGVSWNARDKRWAAYITLNKKRKALGNFKEIEDAIVCRKNSEIALGFHPNHGR